MRLLLFLIFILLPSVSGAFCFEEAGKEYNIAPQTLWTIATCESQNNPHAINYNTDGSYDYGVMQINSRWYSKLGDKLWMRLADPCTNVRVGAWILSDCIQRYGNTWEAIGCYNASSEFKRAKYAWKIYKTMKKNGIM